MMEFIMMTLAIMVGILLASGLTLAVVLNKKVMRAYLKWTLKLSKEITDELLESLEENEA